MRYINISNTLVIHLQVRFTNRGSPAQLLVFSLYYGRIAMTSSPQCQQCSNLEEARAGNPTISKERSRSARSRVQPNADGD